MQDKRSTSEQGKALLLMASACLVFATMSALIKAAGSANLTSFEIAFIRSFVSLVILFPLMRRRGISYFGQNRRLLFARGAIGTLSMFLGFFALGRAPLAEVAVLWKTSTLFTALIAPFALGERFSLRLFLLVCLGLLGSILVLNVGISRQMLATGTGTALIAALGAGFSVSLVALSIRQLQATEHSLTIVFSFCFYASVLSFIFMLPFFVFPPPRELMMLLTMGALGLVGQVCYTSAFKYAPAADVQSFSFLEILFSVLIGVWFWNELPAAYSTLGGAFIILSSIGILHARKRQSSIPN